MRDGKDGWKGWNNWKIAVLTKQKRHKERVLQAYLLREQGLSYKEIARKLGISRRWAIKLVKMATAVVK